MKNNSSKQTDLSIPFNRWITAHGLTSKALVATAKKRGIPLCLFTVNAWRMGKKPRPMMAAFMAAKFPGIKF